MTCGDNKKKSKEQSKYGPLNKLELGTGVMERWAVKYVISYDLVNDCTWYQTNWILKEEVWFRILKNLKF